MSLFALTMLGGDSRPRSAQAQDTRATHAAGTLQAVTRTSRTSRKITSHHNAFQTSCTPCDDEPPRYITAIRHRSAAAHQTRRETLPTYTCTVSASSKVLLRLESLNPLHESAESDWREVYVQLQGTLLSFHRVRDGGPGKLLRSYTLQHAEVGLATDTSHSVLVPQYKIAHLIPTSARLRAWRKDPDLFDSQRQTILRLRVETDQLLLAHADEEQVHALIHAISAGIDIAPAIDERSIPKQCTVPRRRRRNRHQNQENLNDPALLAEQERILREMYPSLAGQPVPLAVDELRREDNREREIELRPTLSREEDDLDLSIIQEESAATTYSSSSSNGANSGDLRVRPITQRQTTASTIGSTFHEDMIYATPGVNFNEVGKWQPPHHRSASQIQRYVRRCIPILLFDAPRASDILILEGKRVKIDWQNETLEEWALAPPSYRSHDFEQVTAPPANAAPGNLTRTVSLPFSDSASATETTAPPLSRAVTASDTSLPTDLALPNLDVSKFHSVVPQKSLQNAAAQRMEQTRKTRGPRQLDANVHGVVFCF